MTETAPVPVMVEGRNRSVEEVKTELINQSSIDLNPTTISTTTTNSNSNTIEPVIVVSSILPEGEEYKLEENHNIIIDMEVFQQLLEIDDDESHEFSKTLAYDYISQAETTFEEIDDALNKRDLDTLSRKGHFLKGSSAALGLQKVQHSCESMQHFGNRRDEHGEGPELSEEEALRRCRVLLVRLRKEQEEARLWMEGFYKAE